MMLSPRSALASQLVRCFVVLCAFGIAALVGLPTLARQNPQELVQQGNKHWDEGSYELALEDYQKALTAAPTLPDRTEIEYRIAVSLIRSQKWAEAEAAIEAFVEKYKETPDEARGQIWRGRLYTFIPHLGYRIGKKFTRGNDVPKSDGKDAPERWDRSLEDAKEVTDSFLRAKTLFERFRKGKEDETQRTRLLREEIELNFDLANLTLREYYSYNPAWKNADWTIDVAQAFDPLWPEPKRVMYLYEQIIALDAALPGTDHHPTVLATFGKATYILQLRQGGIYYPQVRYSRSRRPPRFTPQPPLFIPYTQTDPIRLLQDVLERHPQDAEADRLAYTIALWTEQKGDTLAAVGLYSQFVHTYPKSRWVSDAQAQLDALLRPTMRLSASGVTRPGQHVMLSLQTRNVSQMRFTAYRIYPEEVYGHVSYDGGEYRPSFADYAHHFDPRSGAPAYRRDKIAEWTATTSNNGKHNDAYDAVTTPLDTLGAYLIEARTGDKDEIGASTVAFVSDVTMIQKVDRDSLLVYLADAQTGRPLPDAKLTVWQQRRDDVTDSNLQAVYTPGTTDSQGTCRISLPPMADGAGNVDDMIRRNASTFAFLGPNRYAVTDRTQFSSGAIPTGDRAFRAYVYTDRPLYRPKQSVNYRIVLTNGIAGRYQPAVGKEAELVISGPHGEITKKIIKTGEFGSYSDRLNLPSGVDLGDYSLTVRTLPGLYQNEYGSGVFRVEEYKKPEFTVSVRPEKTQVRVGEIVRAVVSGRYFFGAPVANAKVHYRIFRAPYMFPIPFQPRLDWYDSVQMTGYGDYNGRGFGSYGEQPAPDFRVINRELNGLYKEGDLTTDANGEAVVSFPSAPPKEMKLPKGYLPDQNFTITAEVTDDSRRQVTGGGSVRATATQFRAFMQLDRQFLLPGDTLKVEVRTRDGNDSPVAADGYLGIYRVIPAIPEQRAIDPNTGKWVVTVKYVPEQIIYEGKLLVQTDAANAGSGLAFWHPDTPAEYRLVYTAKDAWGNTITTSHNVLVYGPDYEQRRNKDDGQFRLLPEFSEYHTGETARVLLLTPKPDSYVLFTEAAVGGIVRYRTLFVPGRSTIINVPITADHVPNTQFSVSLPRDGYVMETRAEVGVPAVGNILALKVTPDKAVYKPGEHARCKIVALDAEGKPVRGEFSLGVVDQSLLAMEPDRTEDIRRFFYGYRIETTVYALDSTQFYPGQATFAPSVPNFDQHDLRQPEGMSWIRDRMNNGNQPQMPSYTPPPARTPLTTFNGQIGGMGGGFGGGGGFAGGRGAMGPAGEPQPMEADSLSENLPERELSLARKAKLGAQIKGRTELYALDADSSVIASAKEPAPLVEAKVRRLFSDTAFWTPAVVTDRDGTATVEFDMPDNLTQWKLTARGVTGDVKVGVTQAEAVTKKNLLVRLQAPRFFTERDSVTVSANVHNYLDSGKRVRVELVTEGERLALAESGTAVREITVGKDDEARVDWTVSVKQAGLTKIKVIAQTDTESDAAEMEFPVLVHGVEKFLTQSGTIRNGGETMLTFDLPELRRKGVTLLDVQMQPSIAAMLMDALPYLQEYPYGCVEQTLSRFLPTVLVAKALRDNGLDLETLGKRAKVLEEQRKAIPPQQIYENSGYTYPKGVPGALSVQELARRLDYRTRSADPIFNSATLKTMVDASLQRLYDLQRGDGGWAWWQGSTDTDPYLSALIQEGLIRAAHADIPVKPDVLDRGDAYVLQHLDSTEDLNLTAYYAYVLSLRATNRYADPRCKATTDKLYARRDRMMPYAKALLALALHNNDDKDGRARVLLDNLRNAAKFDRERGTVHWESPDPAYWHWYNDKEETNATILRAFVAIMPQAQLEPNSGLQPTQTTVAPMLVRWLTDNRRAGHWTSTRQTANVAEALLEYAKAQKELQPDYTVTLDLDGKVQKTFTINRENALLFDERFLIGDEILSSGAQHLHITMKGTGTLYYASYLNYFDLQEPIKGVANAIGVERKYYKLVTTTKKDRQGGLTATTDRQPLPDGATLVSGDIIEVELFLKSDNDYAYLVFEDMKPAGCEPLETRSGTAYGDGVCSNFELRDEKVAFFLDTLPQGTRRITYRVRAEVPGQFHALPTNGYALYAPDIRALSDEFRLTIQDEKTRVTHGERGHTGKDREKPK